MRFLQQDDSPASGAALDRLFAFPGAGRTLLTTVARRSLLAARQAPAALAHRWASIPLARRLSCSALLGVVGATAVGLLTYRNPAAEPTDGAVVIRVLIIGSLVAAGIYAQTSEIQTRMGGLLVAGGLFSTLWLLNGSSEPLAFSIGMFCGALAPTVACYLILAHPIGRFHSSAERKLIIGGGGVLVAAWTLQLLVTQQPAVRTPLLRCAPHCPHNLFYVGSLGSDGGAVDAVLKLLIGASWLTVTVGTVLVLYRRTRAAPAPMVRSLKPVVLAAFVQVVLLLAYFVAEASSAHVAGAIGMAYVECAIVIPLAILLGLALERLFLGGALAAVVNELARSPRGDPQVIIGAALNDPSLTIAYRRPATGQYVDSGGRPVTMPPPPERAVTWVGADRRPVAAMIYDAELRDQDRFLEAVGAAAQMRLENARLEAELRASTADLTASRIRLVETAHAERRRIERDLHDGVQQQLVVLRIKLESAAEMLKRDPQRGGEMIATIGRQMDETLEQLRSLARGIYPSVLHERGLVEALKSVGRRSPIAVSVRGSGVGRYPEDVEVAVYFCCLEALQNVAKHGGAGAAATIMLRADGDRLHFEVRDSGIGFETNGAPAGSGLFNMRDRIDAVAGTVTVTSAPSHGTIVWGSVPVSSCGGPVDPRLIAAECRDDRDARGFIT
jgi:signal transduction histidine kinase